MKREEPKKKVSDPQATSSTPRKPTTRRGPSHAYKVPLTQRIGAAVLDLTFGLVPGLFLFLLDMWAFAMLPAALYWLVKDGMPIDPLEHRSVGKKIVGLAVENVASGENKIDVMRSIKRNAIVASGLILWPLMSMIHIAVALVVAAIPPIIELVSITKDPNGQHHGDHLAGTRVLD